MALPLVPRVLPPGRLAAHRPAAGGGGRRRYRSAPTRSSWSSPSRCGGRSRLIVLSAVLLLASGWRFSGRPNVATTLAAGGTSGFLNGLSGMAGPPIAFYYLAGDDPAARVRANLTTYFVFVDVVALTSFASRDLIGWNTGVQALFLAPAIIAGRLAGRASVSAGQRDLLPPPRACCCWSASRSAR